MRDGPAPRWMQHFIPAAAAVGLVLLILVLAGCAGFQECRPHFVGGVFMKCDLCSGRPC